MMAVSDQQVAALRALLTKNFEEHTRLTRQLDDDGMRGYVTLVSAAFFEAVDQRFANADIPAAVIEFVGNARARNAQAAETIDPAVTERVILKSLGHGSISDIPGRDIRRVQNLMLPLLVDDEHLDAAGIDTLLSNARKLAQP